MKQLIVVEGKNDKTAVKRAFPLVDVVLTNGYDINDELINSLRVIQNKREIILFLDPDGPGEKMREYISKHITNCKHAFIDKSKAIDLKKKKVGVEHASTNDIKEALSKVYSGSQNYNRIPSITLFHLGLIGSANSKALRESLLKDLGLGYVNSKQLSKRLGLIDITVDEIKTWIERYDSNGKS